MSFLRFLGGHPAETTTAGVAGSPDLTAETTAVRNIVARLESLPSETARFLAAMAYVLARAANADLEISAVETAAMEQELTGAGNGFGRWKTIPTRRRSCTGSIPRQSSSSRWRSFRRS